MVRALNYIDMKRWIYIILFCFITCSGFSGTITDTNNTYVFKIVTILSETDISNLVINGSIDMAGKTLTLNGGRITKYSNDEPDHGITVDDSGSLLVGTNRLQIIYSGIVDQSNTFIQVYSGQPAPPTISANLHIGQIYVGTYQTNLGGSLGTLTFFNGAQPENSMRLTGLHPALDAGTSNSAFMSIRTAQNGTLTEKFRVQSEGGVKYFNVTTPTNVTGGGMIYASNGVIHITGQGTTGLIANGTVSINTTNATKDLEVNGVIRLTPNSTETATNGAIYFDTEDKKYYGCTNATTWVSFGNLL